MIKLSLMDPLFTVLRLYSYLFSLQSNKIFLHGDYKYICLVVDREFNHSVFYPD
jgi:hypothetical protein